MVDLFRLFFLINLTLYPDIEHLSAQSYEEATKPEVYLTEIVPLFIYTDDIIIFVSATDISMM